MSKASASLVLVGASSRMVPHPQQAVKRRCRGGPQPSGCNYPRGCWQYDIVCGVILAFIFLVPNTIFDGSVLHQEQKVAASVSEERVSISADDEIE